MELSGPRVAELPPGVGFTTAHESYGACQLFFVNKVLWKHSHVHSFVYVMSMAAFLLQCQREAVAIAALSPTKPNTFTSQPFTEKNILTLERCHVPGIKMQQLLGTSNLAVLSSYFTLQSFYTSFSYSFIPTQSEVEWVDRCFKAGMSSGS